jgi:hypothetical protein
MQQLQRQSYVLVLCPHECVCVHGCALNRRQLLAGVPVQLGQLLVFSRQRGQRLTAAADLLLQLLHLFEGDNSRCKVRDRFWITSSSGNSSSTAQLGGCWGIGAVSYHRTHTMYMHKLLGCCVKCLAGRACQNSAAVPASCKWLTCPCSSSLSACSCASSANRAAVLWGGCPVLDPVLPLLLLGLDRPSPGAGCRGGPWHCAQLLAGPGTRLLCPCPCCCSSCCGSSWGAAATAPATSGVASS